MMFKALFKPMSGDEDRAFLMVKHMAIATDRSFKKDTERQGQTKKIKRGAFKLPRHPCLHIQTLLRDRGEQSVGSSAPT